MGDQSPQADPYAALRPYVVDLSEGRFKQSGKYYTSEDDVRAIFNTHLAAWAAGRPGQPVRIVVFAHGGLVGEASGLEVARKHVDWWKANNVYPIYFVWETGLGDAVRSILASVRLGGRDLADYTTDPLVEAGARAFGGVKVWGAMKTNAERAHDDTADSLGGARFVAQELVKFCKDRQVELHAAGHSAGSIFHSWFIPTVQQLEGPAFRTTQFLAPAIRVDEFQKRLGKPVADGFTGPLTIYTMRRNQEQDDNCATIYRKSLLYLIYAALEPERDTPILGLDVSLRNDSTLRATFNLDPRATTRTPNEVVWSVTKQSTGNAASQSTSHGGFDDDPATMSSVAARVLGVAEAPVRYVDRSRDLGDEWAPSTDWADDVAVPAAGGSGVGNGFTNGFDGAPGNRVDRGVGIHAPPYRPPSNVSSSVSSGASRGARRALCIGINKYPGRNALQGCVSDAGDWAKRLKALGFSASTLLDEAATWTQITDRMRTMVAEARGGDSLVFQYSGHGTLVPDVDGDEGGGRQDSALVPIDFEKGAFLIDDDVRAILLGLAPGVHCTVFTDCCHSGTNTRVLAPLAEPPEPGSRARLLVPTPEQLRAHERFRAEHSSLGMGGRGLAARAAFGRDGMRWVTFAACEDSEVAYENNGSGDFTRLAMQLLDAGVDGISNREFQRRVVALFGDRRRQTPRLDCALAAEPAPLFYAGGPVPPDGAAEPPHKAPRPHHANDHVGNGRSLGADAVELRAIADHLEHAGK